MSSSISLLLLSNSKNYGGSFLEHAFESIENFVQQDELVFIPFALSNHQSYGEIVSTALSPLSVKVRVATPDRNGVKLISEASAIFVGGGNSFRLLKTLQDLGVMSPIHQRYVEGDLRYMGSSAGTNLACPTIRTTNDMPIVSPDGLGALGLISFQINAHFQDDGAFQGHMGETRRTRLTEFLEENDAPIVALREGAWIEGRAGGRLSLGGKNGAILFCRSGNGKQEDDLAHGDDLSELAYYESIYDSKTRLAPA